MAVHLRLALLLSAVELILCARGFTHQGDHGQLVFTNETSAVRHRSARREERVRWWPFTDYLMALSVQALLPSRRSLQLWHSAVIGIAWHAIS